MSKRYKAQRTFFYQPAEGGPEQLIESGEMLPDDVLSEGKIEELVLNGFIKETRAKGD